MVVIIMVKITSLTRKLQASAQQHPHLACLTFQRGETFRWDHTACVIYFDPDVAHAESYLLHEFGHALLAHTTYTRDIELIAIERAAWEKAAKLAPEYGIAIDTELIENTLDTYRDWLHARSRCPQCTATGIQTSSHSYRCLACTQSWRTNEARTCALRRYTTTT